MVEGHMGEGIHVRGTQDGGVEGHMVEDTRWRDGGHLAENTSAGNNYLYCVIYVVISIPQKNYPAPRTGKNILIHF
jgi:hypothetical protein